MLASSFSTRFLLRKNRRSRLPAPLGPLFCRPRHGSAAPGPQRQNPGPPRFQLGFCCAKIGAAGRCPHWGQRARSPIFALLKCGPAYSRGVCRGTFLCSPAGPALAPRRLLPFGRISLRETARPVIGPTGADVLACPAFALLKRGPPAKTPALAPIRSHFACGETARPVVAPAGGNVLATPFSLRSNVAPRSHPGPPRFQSGFFCAKTGGRVPPLSDGGALTKSENIILCASSCHPPRSPYPHCTLPHVRFSGIGQKKKPQRKTAAAVNTLYMSCKKTSVNPISFPVALCTKISPFKAIHLLSQCKTKIQFLWMRMRKRSAN